MKLASIGITENPDYLDAMDTYDSIRHECTVEEAVEKTLDDLYDSDPDCELFIWLGLAAAQMRRHELIPRVAEAAEKSIDGAQARFAEEGFAIPRRWVTSFLKRLHDPNNLCTPEKAAIIPHVPKPREYRCAWAIGDIYAQQLTSDAARDAGLYGKYIILRKVGQRKDDKVCMLMPITVPVVYLSLSDHCEGLTNRKALEKLGYLRISDRYRLDRYEYRTQLIIRSKAMLKRGNLIYIGNCKDAAAPSNEIYCISDKRQFEADTRVYYGFPMPWPFEKLEELFLESLMKYGIYRGSLVEPPALVGLETNE